MMLQTFRTNAGMVVKFGQLMASTAVLFPDAYVAAMRSMFQEAPVSSWDYVKSEIDNLSKLQEYGPVFSRVNPVSIHSGSIAQVHEA